MILLIKADDRNVFVGLNIDGKTTAQKQWDAGRELSGQLLKVIDELLSKTNKSIEDLRGIVVYEGPGSYTGLRISISVANAMGYSLKQPVVGSSGESWVEYGIENLDSAAEFKAISPVYGGEVFTTKPKK